MFPGPLAMSAPRWGSLTMTFTGKFVLGFPSRTFRFIPLPPA